MSRPLKHLALAMTLATTIALALALALGAGAARAETADNPQAVVEQLHAALLQAMTGAEQLGYQGRFDLLAPTLAGSFDFPAIARIVTGRHWKALSEAQRAHFIETFRTLSTATYAVNFSGFSGERFATLGTAETKGGTIVRTELVKTDGSRVPLTYLLHKSPEGAWLIVNVIAQGVSDLALKRAEYAAVIKAEGIDSLIKRLEAKIAEMARKS